MRNTTNLMLIVSVLVPALIRPVCAQGDPREGKPCVIGKNIKGTCFYTSDGDIAYWIVRPWRDTALGGGPEYALDEIVGYPALLKKQQEFNDWRSKVTRTALAIDAPASTHYDERRSNENLDKINNETRAMMNGVYGNQAGQPSEYSGSIRHGWESERDGTTYNGWFFDRINAPARIPETGELNLDTLRIPIFMTGDAIFSAESVLQEDCRLATLAFNGWGTTDDAGRGTVERPWNTSLQKNEFCLIRDHPRNKNLARLQTILKARLAHLEAAFEASHRFDRIVAALGHDYDHRTIKAEELSAEFTNRLADEQAKMEGGLRAAAALEVDSARQKKKCEDDFEHAIEASSKKLDKEINLRLEKEFGRPFD